MARTFKEYINSPFKFSLAYSIAGLFFVGLFVFLNIFFQENHTKKIFSDLITNGETPWVVVQPDGIEVVLKGKAPHQIEYLYFLSSAYEVFDPRRIIDQIKVNVGEYVFPENYSLKLVFDEKEILVFGKFPTNNGKNSFFATLQAKPFEFTIIDHTQSLDGRERPEYISTIKFIPSILNQLDSGVIVATGKSIGISSFIDSQTQANEIIQNLDSTKTSEITISYNLTAPLQKLSPYRFEVLFNETANDVVSCYAETEKDLELIQSFLKDKLGLSEVGCTLALGQPSDRWKDNIISLTDALSEEKNLVLTLSDFLVLIQVPPESSQEYINEIQGIVQELIPEDYIAQVITNGDEKEFEEIYDLRVVKGKDGQASIHGNTVDELSKNLIYSLVDSILLPQQIGNLITLDETTNEIDYELIAAGTRSLDLFYEGTMLLHKNKLTLRGKTITDNNRDQIEAKLISQFGLGNFSLEVEVDRSLARAELMSFEKCIQEINDILSTKKITFASGSAIIDENSRDVIQELIPVLNQCYHFKWEIEGHTDSYGNSIKNLELSKDRADAVLIQISLEGIPIENFIARGYGELRPIESNQTKEGRAANRRIVISPFLEGTE